MLRLDPLKFYRKDPYEQNESTGVLANTGVRFVLIKRKHWMSLGQWPGSLRSKIGEQVSCSCECDSECNSSRKGVVFDRVPSINRYYAYMLFVPIQEHDMRLCQSRICQQDLMQRHSLEDSSRLL